jgi:hypothetical protein
MMTKPKGPKTKKIPFANQATEVEEGRWQWTVSGRVWEYRQGFGINLSLVVSGDQRIGAGFFPSSKEAAYFAEGFTAGGDYVARQGKAPPKPLEKVIEDINLDRPEGPTGGER